MYPSEVPTLAFGLLPPLVVVGVLLVLLAVFAAGQRSGSSSFRSPDRGNSFLLSRFLRSYWYWLLRPIEESLVGARVRPETVNYVGLVASALSGIFYGLGYLQAAGFALLAAGCLDMIDGQVARKSNRTSLWGAFLDSSLDRYSEFAVYLGLMVYYRDVFAVWLCAALALGGSFMVSYCRARGEALGVAVHEVGMMQRAERLALLIAASILTPASLALQQTAGWKPGTWLLAATVVLLAAGTNWTALTRFRHVLFMLDATERTAKRPGGAADSGPSLREPVQANLNVGPRQD